MCVRPSSTYSPLLRRPPNCSSLLAGTSARIVETGRWVNVSWSPLWQAVVAVLWMFAGAAALLSDGTDVHTIAASLVLVVAAAATVNGPAGYRAAKVKLNGRPSVGCQPRRSVALWVEAAAIANSTLEQSGQAAAELLHPDLRALHRNLMRLADAEQELEAAMSLSLPNVAGRKAAVDLFAAAATAQLDLLRGRVSRKSLADSVAA